MKKSSEWEATIQKYLQLKSKIRAIEIKNKKLTATTASMQIKNHQCKSNTTTSPCGRRYTDDIKEFSLTLYFYSSKAYEYVRSIIPLPSPSLIRKWSSSVDCEPGFLQEAFKSLQGEAEKTPSKKDCCLIIDAVSIRKRTLWDPKKEQYSGFVNYGPVPPEDPEMLMQVISFHIDWHANPVEVSDWLFST